MQRTIPDGELIRVYRADPGRAAKLLIPVARYTFTGFQTAIENKQNSCPDPILEPDLHWPIRRLFGAKIYSLEFKRRHYDQVRASLELQQLCRRYRTMSCATVCGLRIASGAH
jgi:hypothetical protein